jgi:DNA-binding GntR family transcriptional regulator
MNRDVRSDRAPNGGGRPAAFGRTILREQVRELLLERIVSGFYAPGSRLVETRIAAELGISQAPVREALRDLEQLSCVVHESFRGCSVRELSVADLLEAYPVRSALEGLAAQLAAARIDEHELARLSELIDSMRLATRAGDVAAESTADAAFHATIVAAAGNSVLTRQWEQLLPHARTFISLTLPASAHGDLADRHLPIFDALRRRDPRLAEAAMHAHLADVAERMRPLLPNPKQEETP